MPLTIEPHDKPHVSFLSSKNKDDISLQGLVNLLILLLILANGLFSGAEIAVVSARKVRLEQRAERGDRRARAALKLATAPNDFLSTVQIGITLIGIFAFGESLSVVVVLGVALVIAAGIYALWSERTARNG